jgi:hypothetical protein
MSEVQREEAVAGEVVRVIMAQNAAEFAPLKEMVRGTMQAAGLWSDR